MAYIVADRVKESTTITGTSDIVLLGAATNCQAFSSVMSIGDTCVYTLVSTGSTTGWETGIGTLIAPNTLQRTTVRTSSNNNLPVNFSAGIKDVFMGPTADVVSLYNPVDDTVSGIWNGNVIDIAHGGTNANNAASALINLGAVGAVTSNDGTVTLARTGASVDLSVAVAAATTNVIVQVRNNTGATLTKGTVVYINNAIGQIPTVAKALATSDATSAQTLGMISSNLANNTNGYVTIIGLIDDIDTSAYTDGQQLYLSGTVAGGFTATKPYAPTHLVYVGVVEYAHGVHGKIFVKVQNGYEMDELHNVSAQSPSNGQTLVYNTTTGLWEKNTVSLTAGVNGTLPVLNGGTGSTTASGARTNLGLVIGTDVLAPNGSAANLTSFPTLNQNTTGTAANITATSNSTLTTLSSLSLPGSQVSGNISGNAANVTGTVAVAKGGTGLTALGTANQVITVNPSGTGLTYSTPMLSKLSDVATAGVTSGDLLRYDGVAGAWVNTADVMALYGDSWNTLLRRMNKLMESLTIVDSQQRQRVVVEGASTTTVNGTVSVQSTQGSYTSQLQAIASGSATSTANTYFITEGPVDQRWRIVDDARTCYGINIRSRLTFS